MLIRSLCGRPLTTIMAYSMQLQKQPVVKHFGKNFKLAREQITKISTEFNMSKSQARRMFHFFPLVFKPESKQFNQFKQKVEQVKKIPADHDALNVKSVLEKHIFDSNYLATRMSRENLNQLIQTINSNFSSKEQVQTIFSQCPNLINPKFKQIFEQKQLLLQDYLTISKQQCMEIFEKSPYLLCSSTIKIRESIVVLFRVYGYSKEQIIQLMKSLGAIFMLGGQILKDVHHTPLKWKIPNDEIKEIFLKNPVLFFNYPYNVMPKKRKIFKYMNFTQQMGQMLFRQYPQVLIKSVRSLEEKALFINNRLKLKMSAKILELLSLNFNKTLRPRGQLLVKSKTLYNNDNIVQFMKISDQQFVEKLGIDESKLKEQVAKFPISEQLDFKKSKVISKIGLNQKIKKLASVYQQ